MVTITRVGFYIVIFLNIKYNKFHKNIMKNNMKYYCDPCNYKTNKKAHFEEHMLTKKHTLNTKNNVPIHKCDICGMIFAYASGLCRHKKKNCSLVNNDNIIQEAPFTLNTVLEKLVNVLESNAKATANATEANVINAKTAHKSMSVIKYANTHFKTAPIIFIVISYYKLLHLVIYVVIYILFFYYSCFFPCILCILTYNNSCGNRSHNDLTVISFNISFLLLKYFLVKYFLQQKYLYPSLFHNINIPLFFCI